MTQCPKCGRAYAENFSYCLDDGTPLRHSTADEKTLVMPQSPQAPQPPPPTVPMQTPTPNTVPPRIATPTTQSSNKTIIGAVAVGVVGLFLVVFVWGAIKLGFWYLDRNQNSNQNSTSVTSAPGTSPSSTNDARGLLPSASPASTAEAPTTEGLITPGVYECEVTRDLGDGTKHTMTIRLEVTVNIDGTFSSQGYVTIATANIRNLLAVEERGNYQQEGDVLILSNRRERQLDIETGEWKGWTTPKDGKESREKVRNVTPNTYQYYDTDDGQWYTFTKM